jgi:hypothetical protein
MTTERDAYLWDGSGEPDPEVARLESLLAPLGHRGTMPALPPRVAAPSSSRRGLPLIQALTAAAILALVVGAAWFALDAHRDGWVVLGVEGRPLVEGMTIANGGGGGGSGRLGIGEWLTTDGGSRARISVGRIGRVDVDPNSRVQLVEARGREHRLSLARGTIHARIWAPPKFFYVDTPSAVAVDLGCAYTLQVDDEGAGLVRVTHGWVGFESAGRGVFIPEGAVCATRPGFGPGTPRYEDAPSGYGEALAVLDFAAPDHGDRTAALALVLDRARPRDALTLWHLLPRGTPDERARVFDRMAAVAPPPAGVTREAVLRGDRAALDQWWDALGVRSSTWWRLWKKKW